MIRSRQPSPVESLGARAWIRETVRARGVMPALGYYLMGTAGLLRDLTPSRRRSRYGDIDFDFDHGVDTSWATVSLRTRIRELLSGGQYQPSEPGLFHQMLDALPVRPDGFTFVDLGSGKGRSLLMASSYPFRHIVGVELLAELDAIARSNIVHYRSRQQKCFSLESQAGDARKFVFPDDPTVLYLFNPFSEPVLRSVLANLRASLIGAPRPLYVIYHNLVHEQIFKDCSWLRYVYRTAQFAIYRGAPG